MIFDFADLRPNILNWMVVGLMSVTFITFWKFVFAKWNIAGLSDLFGSV